VKKFMVLIFSFWLLSGCSIETDGSNGELAEFISKYNDAVDIVEKNTNFEFEKLNKDNFSKLEKATDSFGFNQILTNEIEIDAKSLYELKCIYDNNKEIIGYLAYGLGDSLSTFEGGLSSFSDTSLVIGQINATALSLNPDNLSGYFTKAIGSNEEIEEVSYEEKGYTVTIRTDKKVGGIIYKFMKTDYK
jgi:hypothetical protein